MKKRRGDYMKNHIKESGGEIKRHEGVKTTTSVEFKW